MPNQTPFQAPEDDLRPSAPEADPDLTTLNRLYLGKARELVAAGQALQASYLLGLSPEILRYLERLPLATLDTLAESGLLLFGFRVPLGALKRQAEAQEDPGSRLLRQLQWMASLRPAPGRQGE